MLQHLNLRFSSFEGSDVVAAFKVFRPSSWPEGSELVDYGEEEVARLAEHFRTSMVKQRQGPSLCVIEWGELKLEVMDCTRPGGSEQKKRGGGRNADSLRNHVNKLQACNAVWDAVANGG